MSAVNLMGQRDISYGGGCLCRSKKLRKLIAAMKGHTISHRINHRPHSQEPAHLPVQHYEVANVGGEVI